MICTNNRQVSIKKERIKGEEDEEEEEEEEEER